MNNFFEKLKKRWGISGNIQVLIILTVFTVTGFSFVYVNKLIDGWLGMNAETPLWIKTGVFVVILLPVYNLLLLVWGTVFGQYKFFSRFIVRFFRRLIFRNKN